ncbi:MAG: chitobiase/beta-hexosaminidase C-terminal domain-containing protein, partial [Sodaliphilus sp.]|nr:chitobiase/beta-hexosaminidase C-terminal domain-containing protein [Sodaliphilus sp.]
MKRFLFKFFFVLMALIAAIPAQAKTVFFKNTNNWSTVKAHIWNGTAGTTWPGNDMTNLGDGWYCIETGDCKNIQFNGGSSDKQTGDLTIPTEQTECAYNNGWNNWSGYTLYLNHPWGGGTWGTWKKATNNYDGTFSLVEYYGGENNNTGCDYGYTENSQAGYVTDQNDDYVKSIPKNTKCTFTFDRKTNTLTITKNATQLAAPTFTPAGGTFTSAQNVTISAADGATIYYTTDGTDPTTSSTKYESAITVSKTTTIKAIAVKDGHTSSIASATYTLVEPECWYLPGASTSNAVQMTKRADGSFTLTIDIEADATFNFSKKQSTDAAYILGPTADGMYWITSEKINTDINLNLGNSTKFIMKNGAGSYTITVSADYKTVRFVKSTAQADDIPVYPAGVNSETELNAYNFETNPVYYLLSTILNNNRVTPEWQMTKGADGKYHLNGFAMRNTSCRDIDGGKNVEGYIKVRQYVDATTYKEFDKQQVNDLPENPLTDGKLYNATFDPATNKLTLTEDASAKGKMPFISLVGYMMQQDQKYTTPRGIDGKPSGTTTAKGWQEAWLQYDANGKLLKDRKGNVMYSTMWPPKNPVYFTATVGENQRLYSSDQMTFVPVKDAKGDYVGKTGAEWVAELQKLDPEAYKGLKLDGNKTYYRYVVSDIWYVGAGKIWTGWGSQITYSNNNPIAQWSNHTNWGYLNKRADDTDGSPIDPETTYGVGTDDNTNGNFLFENPTYFKTFEFFYETGNSKANSKIYTTRAYGSASIAAQNVKEGESYKKGSYQAKVTVPEGVTISSWTITRHDATTDALAPIGSDNGKVATYTAEKTDPTSTTFTVDEEGLGEGRYYYELTVTFSNGRTSTVRSNPFVIYYPNQYSVDANGYQLVKLDTDKAIDGYSYVTYNAKANGDLYFVNLTTDNKVANFRVATSAERETVNGYFATNSGIKWTDKVFVYAPVPAEFKQDAEKTNATVSLDQIVSYDVNATSGVSPVSSHELAVVDNKGDFANKIYKAVMNYQEKDASTGALGDVKSSLGKENITMMQMPNVKAKDSVVTVTKIANSKELDIIDGDATKKKACNYYEVTLALNFDDPNVITAKAPRFKIGNKVYEGVNAGTRSIKIACVNPLDFANAADITVDAVYYDGTSYTLPATIGEAAVLKADKAK